MKDYHGVQITPCLLIILFLSTCLPMFETGFREDKRTLEGALEQAKIYSMGHQSHQSHHPCMGLGTIALSCLNKVLDEGNNDVIDSLNSPNFSLGLLYPYGRCYRNPKYPQYPSSRILGNAGFQGSMPSLSLPILITHPNVNLSQIPILSFGLRLIRGNIRSLEKSYTDQGYSILFSSTPIA